MYWKRRCKFTYARYSTMYRYTYWSFESNFKRFQISNSHPEHQSTKQHQGNSTSTYQYIIHQTTTITDSTHQDVVCHSATSLVWKEMAHILTAVEGRLSSLVFRYQFNLLHLFSKKDRKSILSLSVEPWSVCRTRQGLSSFVPFCILKGSSCELIHVFSARFCVQVGRLTWISPIGVTTKQTLHWRNC